MGNGLVGAICGAAMAMLVAALVWPGQMTPLEVAALAGGGLGAAAGAHGHDVASVTGMRLLRYVFIAVIFGLAAMVFHGAPAFAALP